MVYPPPRARTVRPRDAGEYRFLYALLNDAIELVRRQKREHPTPPARAYAEAREWIERGDRGLVTFDECCEAFDLDPARVRRVLFSPRKSRPLGTLSQLVER